MTEPESNNCQDAKSASPAGEVQPRTDLPFSTARSASLQSQAGVHAPGGVIGGGRYWRPYPLWMRRASGSRIWDVDGNEFIDYHGAYGPVVLGHNPPEIRQAVLGAFDGLGILFGAPYEAESELCARIVRLIPSAEKTILTTSGSEATYHAIRVARAHTGRERVMKFEGHYHGWHDGANHSVRPPLHRAGRPERPESVPGSAGTLSAVTSLVSVLSWNDVDSLEERFAEEGPETACLILEPILHTCGVVMPTDGFLETCRRLCGEYGVVLIFDEIITAFRQALGGCQELFGVHPDLTIFGKALANGFPLAGVAGTTALMGLFEPEGPVSYSGTFNGGVPSVAAALATLDVLERGEVHRRLAAAGVLLADAVNNESSRLGIPCICHQFGSVWCVYFADHPVVSYRDIADSAATKDTGIDFEFQSHLLRSGIYMQPYFVNRCYISAAHSDVELEQTADSVIDFLRTNRRGIEEEVAQRATREASVGK
jgi:glutamate-1-semialdehyde 2,1-aminomutase